MPRFSSLAFVLLTLAYPFAIYVGLERFSSRYLVPALVLVAGLRLYGSQWVSSWARWGWIVAVTLLALQAFVAQTDTGLRLYPVLVNLSLFGVFFISLFGTESVVEKLARLQQPELSDRARGYTRRVTQVWCVFFVINGGIAFYTALFASREVWLMYNGLIAYVLMGLLAGIEWLVRRRVKRQEILDARL